MIIKTYWIGVMVGVFFGTLVKRWEYTLAVIFISLLMILLELIFAESEEGVENE